ncbi:phosphatidylinositol kinase [Paenibacillus sp. S150]|uniref:phosphatidylinositol kinase n=1 Tax=Paenibacillus sp. S150 TaxID=2749826 RepID=UPI001C5A1C60|nr:phosphatidylinositol kinase [Paenibacillus sp. S150]MBW4083509.1 phosphatidylinositol kinase [Paenibacillus sp. S150]
MEANNYQQVAWSCMNKYVGVTTTDGQSHDGFIAHVDQDFVTLALPTNEMIQGMPAQNSVYRQFGYYPGFYPRRRFYPRRIPLGAITALYLLPFFL